MNYTSNYHLNLPQPTDTADIEKLNENFTTLDTTIREHYNTFTDDIEATLDGITAATILKGSYSGNAKQSDSSARTVSLNFTPSVVLLACKSRQFNYNGITYGGLFMTDKPLYDKNDAVAAEIVDKGIRLYHSTSTSVCNLKGYSYYYIVWR